MQSASVANSYTITNCQVCSSDHLIPIMFLGYLPPVNTMPPLGVAPKEERAFPAEVLYCQECQLVQLGTVVDAEILFPPTYPYTSGTTKILRDNFSQLAEEVVARYPLSSSELVVDVGSNDGTLLSNFVQNHRTLGIEPTNAGNLAREQGIDTLTAYFGEQAAWEVLREHGPAKVVTCTNCFAHIDKIADVVENIIRMMADDGLFISESHYLLSLVETLQYDTIYHEHLRYYSLSSIKNLLARHGLQVVHATRIPTHGGSIRVYAAKEGAYAVESSVEALLEQERQELNLQKLKEMQRRITQSKLALYNLLYTIKEQGQRIHGVGAPSRASTLINHVGLDHGILDCVLEIAGSYKIGKYIPGTRIPVLEESKLYDEHPEYVLLLSWHIAEELMPKLKAKGYRGDFIIPLPTPRIVANNEVR